MRGTTVADLPTYVLDRIFTAPRALVWKAWTDPKILHRWYGPNVETTIHKFDLRAGGVWLNEMNWGGKSDFSKMSFQEVVPLEKIVWHHSSTDVSWNPIANPMMPDWPRTLLTTVTFEDRGNTTLVRLSQIPVDPTESEMACFANVMSRMDKGWGSGYQILDAILTELRTAATDKGAKS
jgi:uncharacterized protein YndB with AHSA1/START domain